MKGNIITTRTTEHHYKAIIFDLFETLYPWGPDKYSRALDALCDTLSQSCPAHSSDDVREHYLSIWKAYSDQNISRLMENDFRQTVMDLVGACGRSADESIIAEAINSYDSALAAALHAPPGVADMIRRLGGVYKIGVLSNYPTAGGIREALRRDGILDHVDAVVVSSDIGYIKPHGKMFRQICGALGCQPQQALLIGDTWESDIVGAHLCGMSSLLIEPSGPAVEQGRSFNGYIRRWLESQPDKAWKMAKPLATLDHVTEVESWLLQ